MFGVPTAIDLHLRPFLSHTLPLRSPSSMIASRLAIFLPFLAINLLNYLSLQRIARGPRKGA